MRKAARCGWKLRSAKVVPDLGWGYTLLYRWYAIAGAQGISILIAPFTGVLKVSCVLVSSLLALLFPHPVRASVAM